MVMWVGVFRRRSGSRVFPLRSLSLRAFTYFDFYLQ